MAEHRIQGFEPCLQKKPDIVILLGNGTSSDDARRFKRLTDAGWTVPESDEQAVE